MMNDNLDLFCGLLEEIASPEQEETSPEKKKRSKKQHAPCSFDFAFDVPEENIEGMKERSKKALLKMPLTDEEVLALASWDKPHQEKLQLLLLYRALQVLKTHRPESFEFKYEAAWVFEPKLNCEGFVQLNSFDRVVNNTLSYVEHYASKNEWLGYLDNLASPDDLRKKLLADMPEDSRLNVEKGLFKNNNPYPFGEI
jgi:hypothetical protein